MIIPANRVCAYGLRVLFVFLLSNAGKYFVKKYEKNGNYTQLFSAGEERLFHLTQSVAKDGGALANWRMEAPLSDCGR